MGQGRSIDEAVEAGRALIASASQVLISTGAGISAESGVPTFRGDAGLWKRHRPEQLATPGAFNRDPLLVWEWYGWRREKVAACAPNDAHHAVATYALTHPGATLVTQNVDGLHQAAARIAAQALGHPAARDAYPLTLHGDIFVVRCTSCGGEREDRGVIDASSPQTLPHCARCGGLERPGVVWYGEPLPRDTLSAAMEAAATADVCVVVGTSSLVYPAAALPLATLEGGGVVIEVNPEATPLSSRAAVTLRSGAARVLPRLLGG